MCKPCRDEESRKPRALICKPSRDEDSRKLRALLCKQSRDRDSRKLRALCKPDGYTWKTEYRACTVWLEKTGGKRKSARKRTRKRKRIHMIWVDKGLSSSLALVPPTSHLSQRSVNQLPATRPSPPAPPLDLPPPPASSHLFPRDLAVKLHTKPRSPLGPGKDRPAFSVHQPCE